MTTDGTVPAPPPSALLPKVVAGLAIGAALATGWAEGLPGGSVAGWAGGSAGGLAAGWAGGGLFGWACLLVAVSGAFAWLGLAARGRPPMPGGWPRGLVALVLALVFGLGYGELRRPRPGPADLAGLAPLRLVRVQARVLTAAVGSGARWAFDAAPIQVVFPRWRRASGKVRVSWRPPPGASMPRIGDLVLIAGSLDAFGPPTNPGQPDFAAAAARAGIFSRLGARTVRVEAPSQALWAPHRAAADLKARAVALVGRGLSPRDAALAGSLLFGTGAVPVDGMTRERFTDLGLAHILAASGMQVTLLVGMAAACGRAAGLGTPLRALLGVFLAVGYTAMCGFAPSVSRAAWMSGTALVADATGRPTTGLRTLWLSALALLLADPGLIRDLGFQFSFLATWGLLTTARRWERGLRGLLGIGSPGASERGIDWFGLGNARRAAAFGVRMRLVPMALGIAAGAVVTPLAAMIWCLPLQLAQFGQLSAWSLPANLFAEFLVAWLTHAGFALAALGLVWEPLALPAPWLVGPPIALLQAGVAALHELPGAAIGVLRPSPWAAAVAYCALVAWQQRSLPGTARLGPPLAAAALGAGSVIAGLPAGRLDLIVLDVGQGDAIVVREPHGTCALVDGGPASDSWDAGRAIVLPALARLGCRSLELAILTHPHADHLGGLGPVLQALPVREVWDAGQPDPSPGYRRLLAGILGAGAALAVPPAGEVRRIGAVAWRVLAPARPRLAHTRSDANNNALVVRLEYRGVRILLAGDVETDGERRLLATVPRDQLRAEILKVPHHGSRFGATPDLLTAVRPQTSLVSAGRRNTFGHPDPGTLARLQAYGPIFRTDRDGAIAVRVAPEASGATWSVKPWPPP